MKINKINFLSLILLATSYNMQCSDTDKIEINFDDPVFATEQEDELTKLINKPKPSGTAKASTATPKPTAAPAAASAGAPKANQQSAAVGKQYSLTPQHQSQSKSNNESTQKSKSARTLEGRVNKVFQFTGSALASFQLTGALSAKPFTVPPLPPKVEQELEKILDYEKGIEKAINDINQDEFKRLLKSIKIIEPKIRIKTLIEDKIAALRAEGIENNAILLAPEEKPGQHNKAKSENIILQQKVKALDVFKDILRAQNYENLKEALQNIDINKVINATRFNELLELIESMNLEEFIDIDRLVESKIRQMERSTLGQADRKTNTDILQDNIRNKIVKKRK